MRSGKGSERETEREPRAREGSRGQSPTAQRGVDKKEGREMIIPTEKVMAYHDYLSVIYGGIPIGLSKKVEVLSNELNHCYHLSNL